MMTRKDYIEVSNILAGFAGEMDTHLFEDLVEEFCFFFQSDNDRFDRARFEKACGIDELGFINA